MHLLSAAPSSGRLALLLTLAWLGTGSGRPAAPARTSGPHPPARRLLYQLGALYIRLFGLGRGIRFSACSNSESGISNSAF